MHNVRWVLRSINLYVRASPVALRSLRGARTPLQDRCQHRVATDAHLDAFAELVVVPIVLTTPPAVKRCSSHMRMRPVRPRPGGTRTAAPREAEPGRERVRESAPSRHEARAMRMGS